MNRRANPYMPPPPNCLAIGGFNPCGLDLRPEQPAVVYLEGSVKLALETGRTRLLVASVVFALAFAVIGIRLVELSLTTRGNEPSIALEATPSKLATGRADILDRNGIVLATTLPTASLYANPRQLRDAEETARQLSAVLPELSPKALVEKLSADRSFVWLKRNLTPVQQYRINRLGIPGLNFQREERRVYPHGDLLSHSVGFTGLDNDGLAGIERHFDRQLRGASAPLQLSLDLRIQHLMAEELAGAMKEFKAIGAAGIVLDAKSGEVLAMVSLPTFDPSAPGSAEADTRFNRATLGIYEMGSVFKIFTTAMALDAGVVTLDDGYDISHPIKVSRFVLRDFKTKEVPRLELAEVGKPMSPSPWREINTMTISYGHGLAVSPLQLASGVAAIVNGELKPATLVKRPEGEAVQGRRVIAEDTSLKMRQLMRLVVTEGTGRKAEAQGYLVGGKTGTADKQKGRGYARDARIASFVGAFPMNDPRYVVFAMVDEPKGNKSTFGYATGGWVAAPVVRRVVERMGPLLGIGPADTATEDDGVNRLLIRAKAQAEGRRVASN
jgi:cell division protein FtsI (penicillin-binding protein 3)